jgi:hypothetical protein
VKTPLEKRLISSRAQSSGILVPKLNEILASGVVKIETEADADFLHMLSMKQVQREDERKTGDGVYSPSGLASCLRRVYLSKNWQRLGLTRVELPAVEPRFYFLTGDFIHLKWQFAMWKLSLVEMAKWGRDPNYQPEFILLDCELPVMSKRGDHGGTIDVLAVIEGELVIVDVKGLNYRSFQSIDAGEVQPEYRIQVGDYMMLWNSGLRTRMKTLPDNIAEVTGWSEWPRVTRGIVLAENKAGPDAKHPAALTEYVVKSKDALPEVRSRLEVLRAHEEEGSLPEIECKTTRGFQFTGCPFAEICRREVRKRERKEAAADSDPKEYRVARPKRPNRSRRT